MKKDTKGSIYTRSDFLAMAEIGVEEGVFEQKESEIISNLLRFTDVTAKAIMTPRTVVQVASEDQSVREYFDEMEGAPRFSRILVYEGAKDHVTGYMLKDDMLAALVNDQGSKPISTLRREILIIGEDFPLPELFSRFVERREHIALVVDQYGGMAGIVTMEDVIETLLGMEIVDELDKETDMQQMARSQWEKRARARGLIEEQSQTKTPHSSENGNSSESGKP
jgi:CBS domain containing-hemolysin-like protein